MDALPQKRRQRSDKGKPRTTEKKQWRGTIYLSRTKYPAKAIVKKLEDHFAEFPGDNISKLFEREMAGILHIPLTQEMTMADLIDRQRIIIEEQELRLEALDKRIERLDRLISRIEQGGISLAPQGNAGHSDRQTAERTDEGAAYLGNMFGGMKNRQTRAAKNA
jgi:hypothetical protein